MEANQLRLILLLIGMALVAAIYLWDRYQRSRRKLKPLTPRQARKFRKEFGLDEPRPEEVPSFSAVEDEDRVIQPEPGVTLRVISRPRASDSERETPVTAPIQPSLLDDVDAPPQAPPAPAEPPPSPQSPAAEPEPELHFSAAERDDLPQLLIQVEVVADGDGTFSGAEIDRVLRAVGLKPGELEIYHMADETQPGQVLFSVANLFKPGTFPLGAMDQFETPGLLFFAQLPGPRDGQEIYDRLLETAYRVSQALGGHLQDENHSALGKQSVQHTRDLIAEHQRQVALAMKKQRKAN